MAVRCGIDLGTCYSAISYFAPHSNSVLTVDLDSADGLKMIRSVVYFPGPGEAPVVGETAWNAAKQHPDRVVVGIKRSMGTGFTTLPIDGRAYSPPEVSAEILKVLVQDAQKYLGEEVNDVVITVPAYFGDNERAATEEAGKLAGLNVLRLLSEPHAAALAYSVENPGTIHDRYLLVYDLGGGTFDVTLIHATTADDARDSVNLKIDTLCKDGNRELGGLDWDRALAELVAQKVMQQHGVDIRADANNEPLLLDNCEKAKRHLSHTNNVSIIADAQNHQVEINGSEFESQTSDLLFTTQSLLEQVIEDGAKHGIAKEQIEVMLTGGSSRMPMVRRMVETVMGRPPLQYKNPELLVTIGAAYWAHLLDGAANISVPVPGPDGTLTNMDITAGLRDVYPAVGVQVLRPDDQGKLVPANSLVVPEDAEEGRQYPKVFATSDDNITEIPIILWEGTSENLDECRELVRFNITGLPPNRPKGKRVSVTIGYDHNGILQGKATDDETGKDVQIIFDRRKKA